MGVTSENVPDLPQENNTSQYVGCDVIYDPALSLENRSYTDSVSSADSTKPLLGTFHSDEIEHTENSRESTSDDPFRLVIPEWDLDENECRGRADTISKMFGSMAFIDALTEPIPNHTLLSRACQKGSAVLNKNSKKRKTSVGLLPRKAAADVHFEECEITSIDNHTRNLLVMSLGITLMFISLGSLRNLQSSLNHEEGIGLYSLAAAYAAYMVGSLFTPFIVKQFQPKSCLVISLIPQLLYTVTNAYPALYIFIPASALQGLGNALLWNAMTTYTTYLAKGNAVLNKEKLEHTISKYFGIFFLVFQWSNVLGNLISSLVFMYSDAEYPVNSAIHNDTAIMTNVTLLDSNASVLSRSDVETIGDDHFHLCGSNYCHSYTIDHAGMNVDDKTKFLLIGVYSGFAVISIVLIAGFLEPLRLYRTTAMKCEEIGGQFVAVMKFMYQRKFLLILLICIYSTMQNGFVTSEVTKVCVMMSTQYLP